MNDATRLQIVILLPLTSLTPGDRKYPVQAIRIIE